MCNYGVFLFYFLMFNRQSVNIDCLPTWCRGLATHVTRITSKPIDMVDYTDPDWTAWVTLWAQWSSLTTRLATPWELSYDRLHFTIALREQLIDFKVNGLFRMNLKCRTSSQWSEDVNNLVLNDDLVVSSLMTSYDDECASAAQNDNCIINSLK